MAEPRLILEIEVPDYNAECIQETADADCDGDVGIVLEELMRSKIALGIVAVGQGGEEVHAKVGMLRGARVVTEERF
jgi:hypothetical protein